MTTRILVVDDDLPILEVYRLLLEPEGYEVFVAQRLYEDIEDVEQLHPHLIILDLRMAAYKDGWHFLQKLKTFPATSSIPLILCTASLLRDDEEKSYLQEQGIPIVYKPFDVDDLLHVIQQLLSKQQSD